MRKFSLKKANGHSVACAEVIPADAKGIVIAVHGFTSSKESPTVQLLFKRLPAAGFGVVGIDLPCHGVEESYEEELRIESAKESLAVTEQYVTENYPALPVYYFASSFGAYISALYISTRPHRARKLFFRSAAVNMPSLFFKENPTDEERQLFAQLEEQGYFMQGFNLGRPVKVTKGFISDLAAADLPTLFDPDRFGPHRIAMAHGSDDPVIDPAAAASFAERFGIEETVFEGEGHSLCGDPGTPDRVVDLAIGLYQS